MNVVAVALIYAAAVAVDNVAVDANGSVVAVSFQCCCTCSYQCC